jgi:hypothetical protein
MCRRKGRSPFIEEDGRGRQDLVLQIGADPVLRQQVDGPSEQLREAILQLYELDVPLLSRKSAIRSTSEPGRSSPRAAEPNTLSRSTMDSHLAF